MSAAETSKTTARGFMHASMCSGSYGTQSRAAEQVRGHCRRRGLDTQQAGEGYPVSWQFASQSLSSGVNAMRTTIVDAERLLSDLTYLLIAGRHWLSRTFVYRCAVFLEAIGSKTREERDQTRCGMPPRRQGRPRGARLQGGVV